MTDTTDAAPEVISDAVYDTDPIRNVLGALVEHTDEAIGNTGSRDGDAYHQGVRDLALALLGRDPMLDHLNIGGLASGLEGFDHTIPVLPEAPDYTASEAQLARAVLADVPDADEIVVGVSEWDNGWWYDHYDVHAVRPNNEYVALEYDTLNETDPDTLKTAQAVHGALTELSERDGPLGRSSSLRLAVTDAHRTTG